MKPYRQPALGSCVCSSEQHERVRARRRTSTTGAYQLWSWNVAYLRSSTRGLFYYLHMILDVWRRKIVGYEKYESEIPGLAAEQFSRAVVGERYLGKELVILAQNDAPQRSSTLRVKFDDLGLRTAYSRLWVSNDKFYSDSLFRTTKYRHDFLVDGF